MKIFAVDDLRSILFIMNRYFQRKKIEFGFLVVDENVTLEDVSKSILDDDEITLLITDYEMGEFNGLDLVREIRKRKPKLKIVCVSGTPSKVPAEMSTKYNVAVIEKGPIGEVWPKIVQATGIIE